MLQLSDNISTKIVVAYKEVEVKIENSTNSLLLEQSANAIKITLDSRETERRRAMRCQLPGDLAKALQIHGSDGARQIHRILNELSLGTEEILQEECVPEVSWLTKIHRAPPILSSDPNSNLTSEPVANVLATPESQPEIQSTPGSDSHVPMVTYPSVRQNPVHIEPLRAQTSVHATSSFSFDSSTIHVSRPQYRPLPAAVDHEIEAPEYWKVLEHVDRQAVLLTEKLGGRRIATAEDITRSLANLTLRETASLEPADHPALFGSDVWLSKFRVGAAGELLVSQP